MHKSYGYVYKTTNTLNGMIYVGQHKWEKPGLDPYYIGSGTRFLEVVSEVGREHFICEELVRARTREELNDLEVYWIDKLDARNPTVGYNIALGGNGLHGVFASGAESPSAKKIICIETQYIFDCVVDAEHWTKQTFGITGDISQCLMQRQHKAAGFHWAYLDDSVRQQELAGFIGKPRDFKRALRSTELHKQAVKASNHKRKGKPKTSLYRPVRCVETKVVFDSLLAASEWCGVQSIWQALKTGCRAGGYHWEYAEET